ncbi:hypothetical protein F5I97DRAFT_1925417 [Phlebopus sp. FC_14]|nr:hypothetical protein F5I97DRAFT_1925417 [Phlebopus sp. FC_14]
MPSLSAVSPALLFPIALLALISLYHRVRLRTSSAPRTSFLLFIAALSVIAGVIGLLASLNQTAVLINVANSLQELLECACKPILILTITLSTGPALTDAMSLRRVRVVLGFTTFLIICEFTSSLIPQSPPLLPAILAALSRAFLFPLALSVFIYSRSRGSAGVFQDTEKGSPAAKIPARISSPTPDTWPFPVSLMRSRGQWKSHASTRGEVAMTSLPPLLVLTPLSQPRPTSAKNEKGITLRVAAALIVAQAIAALCAALDVACGLVSMIPRTPLKVGTGDKTIARTLSGLLVTRSICLLVWAIAVLAVVHFLFLETRTNASEEIITTEDSAGQCGHRKFLNVTSMPCKPKPSLTRFGSSDSASDFLSMRDPFASPPPPPPPPPASVGLGLNEIDVGWNGNKDIAVQYRFPAPRSKVRAKVKDKRKKARASGNKSLEHQLSAQTLLPRSPLPNSKGVDLDREKDKSFRDEARLAQMLLQTLSQNTGECESPTTPSSPTLLLPQPTHVALSSRWSASTTILSAATGSTGRRSGVSTYASCTGEKVRGSRMSMNTVTSARSSRKSLDYSEARKSSATASLPYGDTKVALVLASNGIAGTL